MGAWHEGVYGNDLAQDMLIGISEALGSVSSSKELLERIKRLPYSNEIESQFVIADLEHSLIGESDYTHYVLQLINLEKNRLDEWVEPELRLGALCRFEEHLSTAIPSIPFATIVDWINERQAQDIFSTLGQDQLFDY